MLDSRVGNHDVSPETEKQLHDYLAKNGLEKVKVRINEYDPHGEWQRMVENESIYGPGALHDRTVVHDHLHAVSRPNLGRRFVFAVYQHDPHLLGCSNAGDLRRRIGKNSGRKRNTRVFPRSSAAVCRATFEPATMTLSYIQENGDTAELKEAYRTLYPMVATSAALPLAHLIAPVALIAGVGWRACGRRRQSGWGARRPSCGRIEAGGAGRFGEDKRGRSRRQKCRAGVFSGRSAARW